MSSIKNQKVYLIKRINKLSDEIVHTMELLEFISQDSDDSSDDDSDEDLEKTDKNIIKAFKKIFNSDPIENKLIDNDDIKVPWRSQIDDPLKRSIIIVSDSIDSDDIELLEPK